ncbi:MAG: M1 family peptidase, partial [Chitinophagaceae bacterium]
MKRLLLFVSLNLSLELLAQPAYFQQRADFTIDVSLNDREHTLTAFENIRYTNNSPDTLRFIWFHLWPEAFRNDKTAFSDQLLENGSTSFYFSNKNQKGYINRLNFKVDGVTSETEDHPSYIDVIKLLLPKPLFPGGQISITTPFHVKLPSNFSRGGHSGQSYQVTQWYPKPAVYDRGGWHPMPYLDQGEFYSEYGDYDVRISIPDNYVVAATGELQNPDEIAWLKNRLIPTYSPYKPLKKGRRPPLPVNSDIPASSAKFKELRYIQKSV